MWHARQAEDGAVCVGGVAGTHQHALGDQPRC